MTTRRRAMIGVGLGSILLIFLACDSSPTEPSGGSFEFQTVLKTSLPGGLPDIQGREVVRDRGAWQAMWAELRRGAPAPLPEVDFSREMVVVAVGPGCGGQVTISSIVREGGELVVNGQATSCGNTLCIIADFATHIVRLPRSAAPVRLNVKVDAGLC
jgi:hypothetical protein